MQEVCIVPFLSHSFKIKNNKAIDSISVNVKVTHDKTKIPCGVCYIRRHSLAKVQDKVNYIRPKKK